MDKTDMFNFELIEHRNTWKYSFCNLGEGSVDKKSEGILAAKITIIGKKIHLFVDKNFPIA